MSTKKNKIKLAEKIMSQVKTGQIEMKPKWYFTVGSVLLLSGVMALSMGAIFLINLTVFALRGRGPMVSWKLQMMLSNFPWWAPLLAITGIVVGINLLKKYDFSYKKDFKLIVVSFILAVLAAGFMIDKVGFNDHLRKKGRMKPLYQHLEHRDGPVKPPQRRFP